jgi:hypothetical protein
MVFSVLGSRRASDGQTPAPAGGLHAGSLEYFSARAQSKISAKSADHDAITQVARLEWKTGLDVAQRVRQRLAVNAL